MKIDYPKRKRLRLPDYDYSSEGVYFLTLCAKERAPIFSRISEAKEDGKTIAVVVLTQTGYIVQQYISSISEAYPNISVDSYVIMPDHIHLLLRITSAHARRTEPFAHDAHCECGAPPSASAIAQAVAAFKHLTNRDCKQTLWQDGYYDHIIRDAQDYRTRAEYIETNPLRKILNKE